MTKKWIYDEDDEPRLFYGDEDFNGSAYPCNDSVFMEIIANKLNELEEENEELKKRNDRQAKQLDRLYNLIEEKDWRALFDIIDDFKRCEEQLQKEWGTYGDVE